MDKKFRNAGAGLVYFEDTLLTTDQIVMFLNDGFEKTIELDKCHSDIADKVKFTKLESDEFEFLLNHSIEENERAIEFSKEPVMKKALDEQKKVYESILEKARKM